MKIIKQLNKGIILFLIGASCYATIEILWRGHTHWTMAILGGILFLLLGGLNEWLPWQMPLVTQCIIGTLLVTAVEFAAGLILNVWLGLDIWDYSSVPGNILGQICPQFMIAWTGLSLAAIIIDDWIRYWLWGEQRPHYFLFKKRTNQGSFSFNSAPLLSAQEATREESASGSQAGSASCGIRQTAKTP